VAAGSNKITGGVGAVPWNFVRRKAKVIAAFLRCSKLGNGAPWPRQEEPHRRRRSRIDGGSIAVIMAITAMHSGRRI